MARRSFTYLSESFKRQLEEFKELVGPAISKGEKINFADNDLNYMFLLQQKRIRDKGLTMNRSCCSIAENRSLPI